MLSTKKYLHSSVSALMSSPQLILCAYGQYKKSTTTYTAAGLAICTAAIVATYTGLFGGYSYCLTIPLTNFNRSYYNGILSDNVICVKQIVTITATITVPSCHACCCVCASWEPDRRETEKRETEERETEKRETEKWETEMQ